MYADLANRSVRDDWAANPGRSACRLNKPAPYPDSGGRSRLRTTILMTEMDSRVQWKCGEGHIIHRSLDVCGMCGDKQPKVREQRLDTQVTPMWPYGGWLWKCVAHGKLKFSKCHRVSPVPTDPGVKGEIRYVNGHGPQYAGRMGSRNNLSVAGTYTGAGLACPGCGSTQFTAKRSNKGKMMAGVLAPKTQVKCVACGVKLSEAEADFLNCSAFRGLFISSLHEGR